MRGLICSDERVNTFESATHSSQWTMLSFQLGGKLCHLGSATSRLRRIPHELHHNQHPRTGTQRLLCTCSGLCLLFRATLRLYL
jgi:hypothetical protein